MGELLTLANYSHFHGTCLGSSCGWPEAGENTYHIMLEPAVYVMRWGAPSGQDLTPLDSQGPVVPGTQ